MEGKLIYPELSYKINGLCFDIHNELGRFCKEKQYADKLEELLKKNKLKYKREINLENINQNSPKGNVADFIIDNKIIVDLKAKKFTTKEDYFQMQRYIKATNLKLGLIVNFRNTYLKPNRIINFDTPKPKYS
jgi:GxxExxY protein